MSTSCNYLLTREALHLNRSFLLVLKRQNVIHSPSLFLPIDVVFTMNNDHEPFLLPFGNRRDLFVPGVSLVILVTNVRHCSTLCGLVNSLPAPSKLATFSNVCQAWTGSWPMFLQEIGFTERETLFRRWKIDGSRAFLTVLQNIR